MKKMLLALLMALSIASVADARIAENRIAIGGLYPGQTVSQVEAIYGKPVRVSGDAKTTYYSYNQSNDTEFEVCFRNGVVSHIRISGNNGIATADGIKIGSTKDDVLNT